MNIQALTRGLTVAALLGIQGLAGGVTYPMPSAQEDVIGQTQMVTSSGQSLAQIGRDYGVGIVEMRAANPGVPLRPQAGTSIQVPTQYVLPQARREGIVINLAELRLYYFHPEGDKVSTYPVAIGRYDWKTPQAETQVIDKQADPIWTVPESIKAYTLRTKGKQLPDKVYPGPENPLGAYAIRLGLNGYLIHGTNAPASVGQRVSSGCIRMLAPDIEELYHHVSMRTPVSIVYQPYKAGWRQGELFLEAHKPFQDEALSKTKKVTQVVAASHANQAMVYPISWQQVDRIAGSFDGVPQSIGQAQEASI